MDGLPGMKRGTWAAKEYSVVPLKKMVGPLAPTKYRARYGFSAQQVVLIALLAFMIGMAFMSYGPMLRVILVEAVKDSPLEVKGGNLTPGNGYVLEGFSGL